MILDFDLLYKDTIHPVKFDKGNNGALIGYINKIVCFVHRDYISQIEVDGGLYLARVIHCNPARTTMFLEPIKVISIEEYRSLMQHYYQHTWENTLCTHLQDNHFTQYVQYI